MRNHISTWNACVCAYSQAKRQSRRSAQVAADAALALRDFERSYLSSPSNGDDGKDGAGRFSSSARTDHSPSTCDGEQQHGIPDSSDDLPGDGPKQSSGGSTWSSGVRVKVLCCGW